MDRFEQIISIKRALRDHYKKEIKKEGFPIPSPKEDDEEQMYIGRCISSISDEYDNDQAYAICKSKWDEK